MSAKTNIDLMTRVHELFSHGDAEAVLEHACPDIVIEMYAFGQTMRGREGFQQFLAGFLTAFPDIRITPTAHVADESRVTGEFVAVGTHNGPLMTPAGPIPPTGKRVHFTVCEVWDVRDGKIAAIRNYQDAGSILRQIGAG